MTFITHRFRVSVVSDVRERVRDLGSPMRFMLRRSSLVECVSVLHRTCLQCTEIFFIHQYVQPCLSKNPKYTFYAIKSSLMLTYYCNKLLYPTYDSIRGIQFMYNFYPSGIKYLRNFIHCVKIISFP
jgi:hypothetical protein